MSFARSDSAPVACETGAELARIIRQTPASAVAVRRRAVTAFFPSDLAAAVRALPYEVACVVATPRAASEAGVTRAVLAEVLVFARTSLIGRLPDAPESTPSRLTALLAAGLSPYLAREGGSWDSDDSDAYAVDGRRLAASLALVGEAWQRRLLDQRGDRSGRA